MFEIEFRKSWTTPRWVTEIDIACPRRTPAVSVGSGRQSRTEGEITGILHEGSCGTGRGAQDRSVFSQAKLFHLSLWSRPCKQETPSKHRTQEIRCVSRSAYQWRWEAPRRQAVDTPCPAKHLLLFQSPEERCSSKKKKRKMLIRMTGKQKNPHPERDVPNGNMQTANARWTDFK